MKRTFAIVFTSIGIFLCALSALLLYLILEEKTKFLRESEPWDKFGFFFSLLFFSFCFLFPGLKFSYDYKKDQKKVKFLKQKGFRLKTSDWVLLQNENFEINDNHPFYIFANFELNGISYQAKSEDRMEGFPREGTEVTIFYEPRNPKNNFIDWEPNEM